MKALWGGRFKKEMHPLLKEFSYSLNVDWELFDAEIAVDIAWTKMLYHIGIITQDESAKLVNGLKAISKELQPVDPNAPFEDVHTLIQTHLEKKIGNVAKKIHTGRSRNDLIVTSTRIYLKQKISEIDAALKKTETALLGAAQKAGDGIVAGVTHLRKAQTILLAHHLLAYVAMLDEDRSRLNDLLKRVDVLPLGSAALAGSSLPIDQKFLAKELGFSKIAGNSLAAVSDRGFLTEFLSDLAILWVHLSRLSEDFILWNSEFFNYVEIDDAFATGSSLMPQKKNPDVFELIRGRTGSIFGHLQALLTVQKGLPLSYNRDLQEDKPAVFDAARKTKLALEILSETLSTLSFNKDAFKKSVAEDHLFSTDLLEYLVRKKVPFSEAHETVGKIIRHAEEAGKSLSQLPVKIWQQFSGYFESDVLDLFKPETSVEAKKTKGSTNPTFVKAERTKWEKALK
ncbi:MAG: argininosuccinate lyase [Deltaproteobacteria bacterium RIFCSPLOWO2_02_FULL_46_8]|nr:MAG: argininosuccinate lyase [Deltaproteobacteria bacterium RIFCSPLOWO2_02_FULL_46_8]